MRHNKLIRAVTLLKHFPSESKKDTTQCHVHLYNIFIKYQISIDFKHSSTDSFSIEICYKAIVKDPVIPQDKSVMSHTQ